ncbi:hypothetical protein H5P27_00060 [Pelagicoccus albus]|uniref:TIGR03790 family protein n=1 Tax=Pelagicoccus albus TaxID=415222 RepID=A0A7X1B2S5_9BACT|nr:hypothetical protein [Pelagicoccus albus]MBC2604442.1 hypothetical protein [Pelagicoccus albus]
MCFLGSAGFRVLAGGGPEGVALIVNRDDASSIRVAEHYAELRGIPESNVVHLESVPLGDVVSIAELKERILQPVFTALAERGIAGQIDYLVYSVGFPTRVSFDSKATEHTWVANNEGSLTGMTYLYQFLDDEKQLFLSPNSNLYFGGEMRRTKDEAGRVALDASGGSDFREPFHFRAAYAWGQGGGRLAGQAGPRYLISAMLGVVDEEKGNSVEEVLESLSRSVRADYSQPEGVFYFMDNGDVRTKTRSWGFEEAAERLRGMGLNAIAEKGSLPSGEEAIAGVMSGSAQLDLESWQGELLRGAFFDNLTSFGARFSAGNSQTVISEFIRSGAAAASGAVSEPYALQFKFPTPYLFVNYASGLSLGEAYYRSVASPYNLLLVGDPLCQPYANKLDLRLQEGFEAELASKEHVRLAPWVDAGEVAYFTFAIDGRFVGRCPVGGLWSFEKEELSKGEHRLSVVAVSDDAIASQTRVVFEFHVE